MSVSFIDEVSSCLNNDSYLVEDSPIGKVFIPRDDIVVGEHPCIRYEKHPWIECFEFDDLTATEARREGYGSKNMQGFVQSLYTIYAKAFADYTVYGDDASKYFAHATKIFIARLAETGEPKMFRKFCGFVENMWRIGNKDMHDIALETVLPIIENDKEAKALFYEHITLEFMNYIEENNYGTQEK